MLFLLKPLRLTLKALVTQATPGQLAMGFAFGVMIGMVPKGNLIAITLGIILAASRANLAVATGTMLAVSFFSGYLDPVFDSVGWYILSHPRLFETFTNFYNRPLAPWTDFNNSIVMGSLIVGVACFAPGYFLSKPLFRMYTERASKWVRRFWLTRVLFGMEVADRLTLSE